MWVCQGVTLVDNVDGGEELLLTDVRSLLCSHWKLNIFHSEFVYNIWLWKRTGLLMVLLPLFVQLYCDTLFPVRSVLSACVSTGGLRCPGLHSWGEDDRVQTDRKSNALWKHEVQTETQRGAGWCVSTEGRESLPPSLKFTPVLLFLALSFS